MVPDLLLFFVLALAAVASAVGMLVSRNAVYSALYLIVNFAMVALFYLILGAPFIALAQVTVYAGAIMVLFLFVIMLLGAEQLSDETDLPGWQRPLAIILGVVLLVEAAYIIFFRSGVLPDATSLPDAFGSPFAIGEILFTRYLLPFEVTSILLLVSMLGAIVLTRRRQELG